MRSIIHLARPDIIALQPYSSARNEVSAEGLWLNANENPFALTTENPLNRYPEQQPKLLLEKLASELTINAKQLLLTRGSDEGIDLLMRAFCQAGQDSILICPPTYGMYEISAKIQGAGIVEVPLLKQQGFKLDVPAILAKWQAPIKLIFLCSPNNPTGQLLERQAILNLCQRLADQALIIVDEAYVEFAQAKSLSDCLTRFPNLVILRTLSKAYAMAGARCGMVLAHPDIIELLKKIIAPYPLALPVINEVYQLLNADYSSQVKQTILLINKERNLLINYLKKQSKVKKVWPSNANFLLVEVDDAKAWVGHCAQHNIVIRDRSQMFNLENCVRISIGTPAQNQQLIEVLNNV